MSAPLNVGESDHELRQTGSRAGAPCTAVFAICHQRLPRDHRELAICPFPTSVYERPPSEGLADSTSPCSSQSSTMSTMRMSARCDSIPDLTWISSTPASTETVASRAPARRYQALSVGQIR